MLIRKGGYHWIIWNTKSDGSGTNYNENSVAPAKTTLYAQWSNANTLFGNNDAIAYISIFVADSNGGKEVNIDTGYADLPSSAVFIAKPQSSVTLKAYVDGKGIIAEKPDSKRYIEYRTGTKAVAFENCRIRDDGSAVFEVRQTVSNQNIFLGCFSTSAIAVLDIKGTRDVLTDIMDFSIKGYSGPIEINNTGSIMIGANPEISIKAMKSGTTVEYDGESIIFTLDGKKYNVQFNFSNGAELGGVSVEGDTAVITFTFDPSMDPVFYRVIGQ